MICRIVALLREIRNDWDELNLAAKSLVLIAIILFGIIIFFTLCGSTSIEAKGRIEVVFRSSLASVFGFILSSNTKSSNNKNSQVGLNRGVDRSLIDDCDDTIKEHHNYSYCDGNSIQILIALITAAVSSIVILIIYQYEIPVDGAIVSQFRDLMCTSIGFLLGESKIKQG